MRSAVEDYVHGFYDAEPARIERSVSEALVKKGYWRRDASSEYAEALMTFEGAVKLAGDWNADGRQGADLTYEIEILDVLDKTAAAKLTAKWGIDYFQLVKEGDKWMIHQVMWQSHPSEEG